MLEKGKGFCLEFDTECDLFEKFHKVKYAKQMPVLQLDHVLVDNVFEEQFIDLFRTKSIHWGYEKEWRCIHQEVEKKYRYEDKYLTGIYFGSEMPYNTKNTIA